MLNNECATRILGLDVGDKTIGVAVSDIFSMIAQSKEVIRRKRWEDDWEALRQIIFSCSIATVVIGLPKNMNGTLGSRAEITQDFVDKMKAVFPELNYIFWDERLSTKAAERILLDGDISRRKRKQVIDKMAAAIILQGYLDSLVKKP